MQGNARNDEGHRTSSARPVVLGLLLIGLFILRVYYGLSLELQGGDATQIYLLGLKFFATGQWPFFGPDVDAMVRLGSIHTQPQIAGPLQGLLVGVPLFLTEAPEAPLVLLNVLSFAGLVFLGRYLVRRFPLVPAWITYAWLLTCPWTLNFSTHVYNPSYLLALSCLFFVSFFELMPSLTGNLVSPEVSFFLSGFSLAGSSQLHLSWPLLLPFLLIAIVVRARERILTPFQLGCLLAGAALPSALLVPTVAEYGFASLFAALRGNFEVNGHHAGAVVEITGRFLSFASFELGRFLGEHEQSRLEVLRQSPWLIPFVVGLGIIGLVQPLLMLVFLFRPSLLKLEGDRYGNVRWLVAATLILLCVVFLFTSRPPLARNFYILSPVAFLLGYLALGSLIQTPRARRWAVGILAGGVILHVGLAAQRFKVDPWADRRATVMRAIQERNYRILGERRPHVASSAIADGCSPMSAVRPNADDPAGLIRRGARCRSA
jgi:uncharacterized membrane protein YoaK (UPF0700 family)